MIGSSRTVLCFMAVIALTLTWTGTSQAAPPLTTPDGYGGVALNPLAYLVNSGQDKAIGTPQIGVWHIGLTEADINWSSGGVNVTIFDRIELGYSHEFVDCGGAADGNIDKDNLAVKLSLLPENYDDIRLMPALSVGAVYKKTDVNFARLRNSGSVDYYAVITKQVKVGQLPLILNAGVNYTKGLVRGVLGFGDEYDLAFFGNIEAVVLDKFIVGWEYLSDTDVGEVFKGNDTEYGTNSMWEVHVAYMHDKHLMLVGSYAYTGDNDKSIQKNKGFGGAYVITLQYSF